MNRGELPAYPSSGWRMPHDQNGFAERLTPFGLTIREEFSSRMLAALLTDPQATTRGQPIPVIVDAAVEWADALIERLSQPQEVPK